MEDDKINEESNSNSLNSNSNMINKVMGNISNWILKTTSIKKTQS